MTDHDGRYYIEVHKVGINPNNSLLNLPIYVNKESVPVRIDQDTLNVELIELRARRRGAEPTLFDSEAEATRAAEEFTIRVEAALRAQQHGAVLPNVGAASLFVSKVHGAPDSAPVGGWVVKPYRLYQIALAEEDRLVREQKHDLRVAAAGEAAQTLEEARTAHEKAVEAVAEVAPPVASFARAAPMTLGSDWRGFPGESGVQMRQRKDGTTVYRARANGQVSKSYINLPDAIAWRDASAAVSS